MNLKSTLVIGLCSVGLVLGASASSIVISQYQDDNTKKKEVSQKDEKKETKDKKDEKKDSKKKKEEKKNEYDELLKKGGTEKKGLFTVRHIEDKWYFEIPDSLLGRYILSVTRFTSVPQGMGKFSGEEVNENTIYFEKRDEKTMLMRAYVLTQTAPEDSKIEKTLKASTTDPIVSSFKIIGKNKDKHMNLIEVTNLFMKDNDIVGIPKSSNSQYSIGGQQTDRTFIATMKVFPINIEIASTRTYSAASGSAGGNIPRIGRSTPRAVRTGSITLGLNTSMVLLPKEPMRKRLWDERVGYFTTNITYFNDDQHRTQREHIAARYRLVPKDKKAYAKGKLVEPEKQIVYYIDPARPKKWVPYLIQGINDWNVAFEAAGFKNAIVGKEWPKNDKNMSVDDARYCVLRYLPAEIENAYGPHIIDPRSGEIIESHICWYHNVMNLLTKWYMTQCGPLDKRAQSMKLDDELMGQLIRFVSSHEVGHTLGLRHNMGASHATPVEKLRDKAWVEKHGHTVSIMDYARFNYVAQPEDNISPKGLFPRINDYDKWAIKWGYQYRPEFKDEIAEKEGLMTETTKILADNPRLWFGGEGRDEDPRAQTEDLGDDNVKASEYGIKNLKRVMANLPKWTHQDNYQYEDMEEMHQSVRDQYRRYLNHVLKNLGGHYINNMPGKNAIEIAPAYKQKEVLGYLDRHVFEAPMWLYPDNVISKIGFDVVKDIKSRQENTIARCLQANLLTTIYNDSFLSASALKLDDYMNSLFAIVWKPLNNKKEMLNNTRRSLERSYVEQLDKLINPDEKSAKLMGDFNNSDALLYVLQHLDKVENYVKSQAATTASGINKQHFQDLQRRIKLIRDKQVKAKE